MIIGCGFLFNICLGNKTIHYSIALIGCILTGVIAARQVFLHILPGDLGYGSTFFDLHFYTWSLVSSILFILFIAVTMILERGISTQPPFTAKVATALFILLIAANLVSTVLECGIGQCADDPTFYQMLKP